MDFGDFQAHLHICIGHSNAEKESGNSSSASSELTGRSGKQTIRKKFDPETSSFI